VIDGIDQAAFVTGQQEKSDRIKFPMYFDNLHVGWRYKNFKILSHKVENAFAPIQKFAVPHVINLTVNPDEDLPMGYEEVHSWMLYKIVPALNAEFYGSLKKDCVPFMAPLDFNPYKK
jgi:arylsulfatase